jgi:hypothetical protein
MSEYVVIDAAGRFLGYGPKAWHAEFPEARTFEDRAKALAAARHTKTLCEVVEDYGLDTQRSIETVG